MMAGRQIDEASATIVPFFDDRSFVCSICERRTSEYAFIVHGSRICRCANCHTLASERRDALGDPLLEEITKATVNHDPGGGAALVVSTIRERGAAGPYLIVATANDIAAGVLLGAL